MAEQSFRWARNTYMDEMRETYLQLAQFWLDVASKLDAIRNGCEPNRLSAAKLLSKVRRIAANIATSPEPASVTKNREWRDGYHRTNRHSMAKIAKPPGLGR